MSRPLLRALAPLIVTGAVATALLTAPVTTASAAPAGAPAAERAERPRVGSCHALTYRETIATTDADPAVDCDRIHTGRTFLVPTVPRRIRMSDNRALARFVAARCGSAFNRATSPSPTVRALSAYSWVYFKPTSAQIADGARWMRCDLVLLAGRSLAPLPDAQRPALGRPPHPNNEARCALGRSRGYLVTVCTRAHTFRARSAFVLRDRTYPTKRERQALGDRRCRPTSGRQWLLTYPTRAAWNAGYRVFVCSSRTSR